MKDNWVIIIQIRRIKIFYFTVFNWFKWLKNILCSKLNLNTIFGQILSDVQTCNQDKLVSPHKTHISSDYHHRLFVIEAIKRHKLYVQTHHALSDRILCLFIDFYLLSIVFLFSLHFACGFIDIVYYMPRQKRCLS